MKRPSFQFYPGDWQTNSNLKRCTRVEKSVWIDLMCLMHDSEEYGVLRWPLKEIAEAANCKLSELRALVEKGVLKGADKNQRCEAFVYVPRSGRKDGDPVELLSEQEGPIWYSSRMVRDEHKRVSSGGHTRFGSQTDGQSDDLFDENGSPGPSLRQRLGDAPGTSPSQRQGDGASSSSSSSKKENPPSVPDLPEGFLKFWKAWPASPRKADRAECLKKWKSKHLEPLADTIVAHVDAQKSCKQWLGGYEPAPLTYLNRRRWEDAADDAGSGDNPWAGAK